VSILPLHIASMSIAFLAMMSAIIAARYFKTKKWWFKVHKTLNIAAVSFAIAGFVFAFFMVQAASGGPHIRVSHAVLGITTLLLLLTMPVLGAAIFKAGDKQKISKLKQAHRYLGRLTALMLTATIVAGLSVAGIL